MSHNCLKLLRSENESLTEHIANLTLENESSRTKFRNFENQLATFSHAMTQMTDQMTHMTDRMTHMTAQIHDLETKNERLTNELNIQVTRPIEFES